MTESYGATHDPEAPLLETGANEKSGAPKTIMGLAGLLILGGIGVGAWYLITHASSSSASGGGGGGGESYAKSLNFTALGDWGTSPDVDHQSSTQTYNCQYNDHAKWNQACWENYNAQENLGWLMGKWADKNNISFVLSQGDNMYWDGVKTTTDPRWNQTFESVYNYSSLFVPWLAVMGNHDYGGGSDYAGGDGDEKSLELLFQAQKNYVSHIPGREWHMDHYHKKTFTSVKQQDGSTFDIEVFNIDTNVAQTHGYDEICCQIYPLGHKWSGCGDPACRALPTYKADMGCNPNEAAINSCRQYLKQQFADSVKQLSADLAKSTARWKIVNSHYHPRMHMPGAPEDTLNPIFQQYGVHAVFCGHTHAEGHDYNTATQTHFFLNGAGGGIRLSGDDDASKDTILKTFTHYAFMGMNTNKDSMRVVFWGYDMSPTGGWTDWSKTKTGKAAVVHCWHIPNNGSLGQNCTADEVEQLNKEAQSNSTVTEVV